MSNLRKSLSNVVGWRTNRKIVVIESDDWGSVRTRSKRDYDAMLKKGLEVDRSNFTKYDSLESNTDLENLFELLNKHKDSTGRSPVFTPMCIVANPDFEKIKASFFQQYYYEPFTETCAKYSAHNKVNELWKTGINERLFVPQLHGREHLNVFKWMNALSSGDEGLKLAFNHESFGASWFKNKRIPDYLAAFDPETESEINAYESIIESAAKLFISICGYKAEHFIASNSSEPKSLENTLNKVGIKYLSRYKIQRYPLGNGRFNTEFNWLGKQNNIGQIYLTRNVSFEPSDPQYTACIDTCLNEIKNAFSWKKPAIISTHRVNYIGSISQTNSDYGLNKLKILLNSIIKKWPDIEFMTSNELGELILLSKKR